MTEDLENEVLLPREPHSGIAALIAVVHWQHLLVLLPPSVPARRQALLVGAAWLHPPLAPGTAEGLPHTAATPRGHDSRAGAR